MNAFEASPVYRLRAFLNDTAEDISIWRKQTGKRYCIDKSDRSQRDHYSVAVIIKNEARYIEEFVLFYKATGADRIYIYDNDSSDDLVSQLEPFLKSGTVIYRKWNGDNVQASAYRDAVRRTRRRTNQRTAGRGFHDKAVRRHSQRRV